jgi:hypothetical protein
MLYYPKIPGLEGCPGGPCIGFRKLDGTNLHFDWHRDFGLHAFGTRRDSFNLDARGATDFLKAHPELVVAMSTLAEMNATLERLARSAGAFETRIFAEVFGPRSFAGVHHPGDVGLMRLVPFDMMTAPDPSPGPGAWRMLDPELFVDLAKKADAPYPEVVFRGKFSGAVVERFRESFNGEGVVFKGSGSNPWMAKLKTDAYLARLREVHGDRWTEFA